MVQRTRNQINIFNLIEKYESRLQASDQSDWRLEEYLKAIFLMLENEECQHGYLNDQMLASKKKAEFFRSLLEAQRNSMSLLNKLTAMNTITGLIPSSETDTELRQRSKQMHEKKLAKCERDIRKELLNGAQHDGNESSVKSMKNYQDIVKYHNLLQENLTKDMVGLTKMLKNNATISNEIIKKDNEMLERTSNTASSELDKLQKNTNKIREFVNAACEYATWILLFLVIFTFFGAVVFMRLFRKR